MVDDYHCSPQLMDDDQVELTIGLLEPLRTDVKLTHPEDLD
jgi:hypothetical protein